MSKPWNPNDAIVQLRGSGGGGGRGFAVGVFCGAVLFGTAAGAVLSWNEAPSIAPQAWVPAKAEILIPETDADPADAEWAGRAEGRQSSSSTRPGRMAGATVRFGQCHTGGGTNCVVDGDTFYLAGAKVRIAGIDAPETHPPRCPREARLGSQATAQLQALLNSGAVTMTGIDRDRDRYGRLLRNVAVDGADVGEALIAAGVAREYGGGRRGWC